MAGGSRGLCSKGVVVEGMEVVMMVEVIGIGRLWRAQ